MRRSLKWLKLPLIKISDPHEKKIVRVFLFFCACREKLFDLLPYYLMRHEDRFDEYEVDEEARREFIQECAEIQKRMEECFMKDEDRSGTYRDLMYLILKISNYLLAKHEKTKEEVTQQPPAQSRWVVWTKVQNKQLKVASSG